MEHWSDEVTHEALTTPEARTAMQKYATEDDFRVGAVNAMKAVGSPYRLPKSLDSLPDDNVRSQFQAEVKALQDSVPYDAKQLEEVNFAEGLPDARLVNEDLTASFKEFASENKMSKSMAQKLAAFTNSYAVKTRAAQEKADIEAAEKVNEQLKALYGGDEGVKQNTENVKRLFMNHCGLTAEEYEASAQGLVDSGITKDPVLCKALFNLAKSVVPEGSTDGANPPGTPGPKEGEGLKAEMSQTAAALGW